MAGFFGKVIHQPLLSKNIMERLCISQPEGNSMAWCKEENVCRGFWMRRRRKGLHFYAEEKKINKKLLGDIGYYVFWALAMIFLAFAFVYLFGIRTGVIGESMEPTLYNGQEILIDRFSYYFVDPGKNDVIVFLPNGNENAHYYVKRVIGVPGDTIQIKNGEIYLNGIIYRDAANYDKIEDSGIAENEILLGEDEYFVLGDNRNNSEDSRSSNVGIVLKDYIIGKAWFHFGIESENDSIAPGFIK